jgi:Arc/MetJ-type ribon-helix-helix transcriptional regulator
MAEQNPTGRGAAVALKLPADHVRFMRGIFTSACAAVRDELREYPDQLKDPDHLRREVAAYGRLLAALDELVIVPDRDVRDLVGDLAQIIDDTNEYKRVIAEHEALHGLHAQLGGGEGR